MIIDKENLISLLEKKTGLERDDVESQLSELINRIQQAADEGKTFEVEGFGTFGMQEGTLHFEPNDRLQTEINNKYAGMKPIELIGAFKEPEADEEVPDMAEPEDPQSDEKWEFDSGTDHDDDATEYEEATEETVPEPRQEVSPPTVDVNEESADDVFDAVFGSGSDTTEEDIEPEKDEEVVPTSKPEKELQEEKSGDTIGTVLVALVVVISLGISGWVIYDLNNSATNSPQNSNPSSQQTESMPQSADDESKTSEDELEQEDSEPEGDAEVPTEEESEETQANEGEERYGLQGTPDESINAGYTIVVHSLKDGDKAEQNRQRLQEAGFRAIINQAQIQGTTYYRVGIGQFETIEDAQNAIEEIPQEHRKSNFIRRIQ